MRLCAPLCAPPVRRPCLPWVPHRSRCCPCLGMRRRLWALARPRGTVLPVTSRVDLCHSRGVFSSNKTCRDGSIAGTPADVRRCRGGVGPQKFLKLGPQCVPTCQNFCGAEREWSSGVGGILRAGHGLVANFTQTKGGGGVRGKKKFLYLKSASNFGPL